MERTSTRVRLLPPVNGHEVFDEGSGTKHLKPDLETACLVEGLLDRFVAMRPGPTPSEPQRATLLQHSVTRLPVVFERA